MTPNDLTDANISLKLARSRWGPTGFRCPHCGNDRAYHLAPRRPRVFQCTRCRKQRSVTAGTAMHGTKLPLRVWVARGEWLAGGDVPSSRGFALEHGIASSSAWHLNQRFMSALDLGQPEALDFGGYLLLDQLKCRRPKLLAASPPDDVPSELRRKTEVFLERRPPLLHEVVLGVGGREIVLVDGCPTATTLSRLPSHPMDYRVQLKNRGIDRWLSSYLEVRFKTVCVRWVTRYVRHLLQLWNHLMGGLDRDPEWIGPVLAAPRRNVRELRAAAGQVR
jgi:hypothetical protein